MAAPFTPLHRGGSGPPLVLLHGFADTWRSWELVLPALERRHEVLALTLPGHAGGPAIEGEIGETTLADVVERELDAAGLERPCLVGNSLGGFLALQLAARGRAERVVAFAPGGGWERGGGLGRRTFAAQVEIARAARAAAPHAAAIVATPEGRRQATRAIVNDSAHIPPELVEHLLLGVASCPAAEAMLERAPDLDWELDAERIDCPLRFVWGTGDRLLPWPAAAVRYRTELFPDADWIELDGVGHCPQLEVPTEAAALIVDFTGS